MCGSVMGRVCRQNMRRHPHPSPPPQAGEGVLVVAWIERLVLEKVGCHKGGAFPLPHLRGGLGWGCRRNSSINDDANPPQRPTRVQVSPPQSAPTQPSTLSVAGPATEMLL